MCRKPVPTGIGSHLNTDPDNCCVVRTLEGLDVFKPYRSRNPLDVNFASILFYCPLISGSFFWTKIPRGEGSLKTSSLRLLRVACWRYRYQVCEFVGLHLFYTFYALRDMNTNHQDPAKILNILCSAANPCATSPLQPVVNVNMAEDGSME